MLAAGEAAIAAEGVTPVIAQAQVPSRASDSGETGDAGAEGARERMQYYRSQTLRQKDRGALRAAC